MNSQWRVLGPLVKALGNVRVERRRLGVQGNMESPDPAFADEISVLQEYGVFNFDILKTDFSLAFEVHRP